MVPLGGQAFGIITNRGITVTVHLTILFDSHAFGPEWSWLKIFFRNTGVMYLVDCGSDAAS
jgi:hypothetical protein